VIARLRARHRAVFVGLVVALPLLAVGALVSRPEAGAEPIETASHVPAPGIVLLLLELHGAASAQSPLAIQVLQDPDWNDPDVLLYWSPSEPEGQRLPVDARLIGPLGPVRDAGYPLTQRDGWFSLYSVARQEILASSAYVEPGEQRAAFIHFEY
jgi:hypothetical protein